MSELVPYEQISCPICDSDDFYPLGWLGVDFLWLRCEKCGIDFNVQTENPIDMTTDIW